MATRTGITAMSWTIRCLAGIGAIFALSANAAAAEFNADKVSQVIHVYEATVSYPPPSWQKTTEGVGEHEYFRNQQDPQFVFEQIPKGETFESWSTLYAVHGLYVGNAGQKPPLDAYVNMSLGPFFQACGKENFAVQNIAHNPQSISIAMFCTDSPHAGPGMGYGPGVGEIAVMTFHQANNTFVKVYQEWRGKSFSLQDKQSWPVQEVELQEMIRRLSRVSVTADRPRPNSH